jgi:hypothetical protein
MLYHKKLTSCHDMNHMEQWCFMMRQCFYHKQISTTNSNAKFITTWFNKNTQKALCIIVVYKPSKMKIIYFNSMLETIFKNILKNYPIILIGDVNVDMLIYFFNQQRFKTLCTNIDWNSLFFESITINDTQINHI